jgi:hypothetical protein
VRGDAAVKELNFTWPQAARSRRSRK